MNRLHRYHRAVVRGKARGAKAALVRGLLSAAAIPYAAGVLLRNAAYDRGLLHSDQVPLPIVSVGNITAGGVGKTPFVETAVRWLIEDGRRPVIVSRGYKGTGGSNDEALLLRENLPDTPHLQNPDRRAAASEAAARGLGDVVVLDDGFQHRRLARAVDIVLLDATDPFGGGRMLPAGFLREPISSLRRADAVVLTRCNLVSESLRLEIRDQIARAAPNAVWAEVDFTPTAWVRGREGRHPLELLRGEPVVAFCGVGNPEAFRQALDQVGVIVTAFEAFPDHHWYRETDLESLTKRASSAGATALVATQKDAVKIPVDAPGGVPLYYLGIQTVVRSGEPELRRLVSERVSAFAQS